MQTIPIDIEVLGKEITRQVQQHPELNTKKETMDVSNTEGALFIQNGDTSITLSLICKESNDLYKEPITIPNGTVTVFTDGKMAVVINRTLLTVLQTIVIEAERELIEDVEFTLNPSKSDEVLSVFGVLAHELGHLLSGRPTKDNMSPVDNWSDMREGETMDDYHRRLATEISNGRYLEIEHEADVFAAALLRSKYPLYRCHFEFLHRKYLLIDAYFCKINQIRALRDANTPKYAKVTYNGNTIEGDPNTFTWGLCFAKETETEIKFFNLSCSGIEVTVTLIGTLDKSKLKLNEKDKGESHAA